MDPDAIELHAIYPSAISSGACRFHALTINSFGDLRKLSSNPTMATCLIFMHQRHSFRPLNATRDILQALASHLDMSPALLDVLSNFYQKVTDLEETYCAPLVTGETAQHFEYMYIFKYPEENNRSDGEPWSIRKTAVYHQLDKSTGRSVYVIVSPLADSAGAKAVSHWLKHLNDLESCKTNAFAVNQVLLSTYQPGFRSYAMFYEKKIKELRMKLMSIGLVNVDEVTPDEMADLCYFESKILPLEVAATAAATLYRDLQHCSKRLADHTGNPASFAKAAQELEWLRNYEGKATACANNAGALLTTCERAVQLLDRVLNLKNQQVAQQQNTAILALTKSTVDDSATR
ncbi:hypothetical protein MBLNU13_g08711t2 [Cladosporium sp. NU13]